MVGRLKSSKKNLIAPPIIFATIFGRPCAFRLHPRWNGVGRVDRFTASLGRASGLGTRLWGELFGRDFNCSGFALGVGPLWVKSAIRLDSVWNVGGSDPCAILSPQTTTWLCNLGDSTWLLMVREAKQELQWLCTRRSGPHGSSVQKNLCKKFAKCKWPA